CPWRRLPTLPRPPRPTLFPYTTLFRSDKFGSLIEAEMNQELKEIPGAGAAGGLGFAFLALGASLISGAELVANTLNLEQAIKERSEEHTSELQSRANLVCRLLLEKKET